jgi:VIT1/CCC1 family predicted Fe2+/Mn2+ transporter
MPERMSSDQERQARAERIAVLLRRAAAIGFGLAMVAAPFLALLLSWAAGLVVMALGLGATAWLLYDAGQHAELDPPRRRLTMLIAGVNAALAVACVIVLIVVRPG